MKRLTLLMVIASSLNINQTMAQVTMVKDINPIEKVSGISSNPKTGDQSNFFNVNGILYFEANDGNASTGWGLYKSDGTDNGTQYVGKNNGMRRYVVIDNNLYLIGGGNLLKTSVNPNPEPDSQQDGTGKGTFGKKISDKLKENVYVNGKPLKENGSSNNMESSARNAESFKGFTSVKAKDDVMSTWYDNSIFTLNDSTIYFFVDDGKKQGTQEIWKSDGTKAGTQPYILVKCRFSSSQFGIDNMVIRNKFYFVGQNPIFGNELWVTDGTVEGTRIVKDINKVYESTGDTKSSNPSNFIDVNGVLYFTANDGVNGVQWWKSDGTEAGTTMIANKKYDITAISPYHKEFIVYQNSLYFIANSSVYSAANHGNVGTDALWKTDGTDKGTVMVTSLPDNQATLMWLSCMGDKLFFVSYDSSTGEKLWKTDGTAKGTTLVKKFHTIGDGIASLRIYPNFVVIKNSLYFVADDGVSGCELWKTDGTESGTTMLKDINPFGNFGSNPMDLINVDGTLYFSADDGPKGRELWKYVPPSNTQSTANTVTETKTVTNTNSAEPDAQIAVQFLNEYAKTQTNIVSWLGKCGFVTKKFIDSYTIACKEQDKELKSGGEPIDLITGTMEYCPNGYTLVKFDPDTKIAYFMGVGVEEMGCDEEVQVQLLLVNGKWLVNGSGMINMPAGN